MFRKNKLAMLVSEFLGTAVLALAVLALSHSQLSYPYFIASAAGLTLVLLVVALAGISGAVFNPALTIGLWTVRKLRTLQALSYIIAQFAGAAAAWYLFVYFTKLDNAKNNGTYDARLLVAEAAGTFVFSFAVASAIYQRLSLGLKAFMVGGGLTAGAIIASLGSAGVLNPAVAFSVHQFGWGTYVLGPVLGAVVGFNLYNLLFVETEVAEAAEAKAEAAEAKVVKPAVKTVAAQRATAKKSTARKAPAKRKTTSKK
ncbi:aquaporin [Candidatus Saccharibacteria bacterium]|nr:MAG: aquaporin [Candidatus Saccharibacteria bacterium]